MEFSHEPVLLEECMDGLNIRPDGIYVDGTLGGGGHSSQILKRLGEDGRLIGIDRDGDAIAAATARLGEDSRFQALRGNFHDVKQLLDSIGINRIDGMLLDLGVSSYQLDEGARGFSYHADAPLDMRMDRSQPLTARDVVNTYSQQELTRVMRDWGEENWAAQIARVICDRRKTALVLTAQAGEENSTWRFSGDVYKLLNNSGVDYLVFSTGEYMTALPTAGFTGGTQYGKLKASGVSTRKFEYTLCQDEALRETTLSVQVEGETYLLEEDTAQPMYRYDVLVGTTDLMKNPYESYKHKEANP